MSREQVIRLGDRSTWRCPTCVSKEELLNQRPNNPGTGATSNSNYKIKETSPTKLKILQFNIAAISSKKEELKRFLAKHKIDIILLQETKMVPEDATPKIPGYTIIRNDRPLPKGKRTGRGGGTLIGIRNTIPFKKSDITIKPGTDQTTEAQTIEIPTTNNNRIRITNVYIPPCRTTEDESAADQEDRIVVEEWPHEKYDIILGDTNAHSPLWDDSIGDGASDKRGKKIEEWLATTGMATINSGDPTHTCKLPGSITHTAPDTSFAHPSMLDKLQWTVINDMSSDHLPMIITYDAEVQKVNNTPTYKWRLEQADWRNFTKEIEEKLPKLYPGSSLDKIEKKFRKTILKAANNHVGKKKITPDTKCWLSKSIKIAIDKRNKMRDLRSHTQEDRDRWVAACQEVAEMIREEKEKKWKDYVEELDRTTNTRKVWRTIR